MKPEDQARQHIDELLTQAGWVVQDRNLMNMGAGHGIAVREYPLLNGPTDYLLFVDREAVGIVEAKSVGQTLTGVEEQSAKYRTGVPEDIPVARNPLPFAYETTGIETRFTSYLDPEPRSRPVFAFHRPETLAEWLEQAPEGTPNEQNNILRARLRRLPPLPPDGLRDCQIEAITNLEHSFAENRPRALVQMTMGSGKTYMAVESIYRLIRFGGARRVLFLVDRSNLGRQTLREFQQFIVPGDGRKFTELYNVQHLQSNAIDQVARVCITNIQRLYSIMSGETDFDPEAEERSLFEQEEEPPDSRPRKVLYNPNIPIETFDIIFTDECHRSIYNQWRGVLEYFDASIVGLTATPNKQTFGFFNRNLVMEYGHDRAVADGVNVDYHVYRIRTEITEQGSSIEHGYQIDRRNRKTRARRWEPLDDDLAYTANQLDRDVVAPDQIRTVIRAFKDALFTDLFPGRQDVPKTLIFAKDDSHADDIVQIVREEFGKGNDFAQKITYKTTGVKPEELIQSFRNSYNPRIAVTVDMIATGTDIKPLEVLLFMRSVKSQSFFEQMKGRGTRTIKDSDFQAVTADAGSKTHFVLVDAVGVYERLKVDDPPLDRKPFIPLEKLLEAVAVGKWRRDPNILPTLAGRLGRLATRIEAEEAANIEHITGGHSIRDLANGIVHALDPDAQVERAKVAAGMEKYDPPEQAINAAAKQLLLEAAAPFDNPDLRQALLKAQQRDEQIIDTISQDSLLGAVWDVQAEEQAHKTVASFREFIEQHLDEIIALQIIYNRPAHTKLRFNDLKHLRDAIAAPPLGLTTDKLWQAYETLERSRIRDGSRDKGKHNASPKRPLTDLVSLIRYTMMRDDDTAVLEPYSDVVTHRFAVWLSEQERLRGQPFTVEQCRWLEMIRDTIVTSLEIDADDFDEVPFNQYGGLGKAYQLFGADFPQLLEQLNERLAA